MYQTEDILIDQLQPCTSYNMKISTMGVENKDNEIYSQNFKTVPVFDGKNDTLLKLQKSEVILVSNSPEIDDNEFMEKEESVVLTWADRCVDDYIIKLCRIPLECLHDNFTSISATAPEIEVTKFEFIITKLN